MLQTTVDFGQSASSFIVFSITCGTNRFNFSTDFGLLLIDNHRVLCLLLLDGHLRLQLPYIRLLFKRKSFGFSRNSLQLPRELLDEALHLCHCSLRFWWHFRLWSAFDKLWRSSCKHLGKTINENVLAIEVHIASNDVLDEWNKRRIGASELQELFNCSLTSSCVSRAYVHCDTVVPGREVINLRLAIFAEDFIDLHNLCLRVSADCADNAWHVHNLREQVNNNLTNTLQSADNTITEVAVRILTLLCKSFDRDT